VLAPLNGSDLPTVVILHGGGTPFEGRRYMQNLAAEVARRGAVVFLLSYRSAATGNYDSAGVNDARCAVRFARAETEQYGGDPNRVAVIGHSQGGFLGLTTALEPETDAEACLADGSGRPDAVIGLGAPAPRVADVDSSAPPIWLFFGSADTIAQGTPGRLEDAGIDVEVEELPGVTHPGIVDPAEAPDVVDLILEALDSI
jgi:acetyl esterase/lipase